MSAWTEGIIRFHTEAAGAFDAQIVRLAYLPMMAVRALAGDAVAQTFIKGVDGVHHAAVRHKKPLCGDCDYVFWPKRPPGGYLLLLPMVDDPSQMIVCAICPTCMQKPENDLIKGIVRRVWPDVRLIDAAQLSSDGGRA